MTGHFGTCVQCGRWTYVYPLSTPTWGQVQGPAELCIACGGKP